MKTPSHRFFQSVLLALSLVCVLSSGAVRAAQQCLVIGDSLSKEYEIEFPILYPSNRAAWDSRNWIEILNDRRGNWFDLGRLTFYPDVRIVGHKYNWAFPGAKTSEIRARLASTKWYDRVWQNELKKQLRSEVERVVIFASGNDVDDWYGRVYNGASPTPYVNRLRDNLTWITNWVRSVRSTVPVVLVAVPHLGCVPDVRRSFPTDPIKTGRVTKALDSVNAQLAAFAKKRGVGFASDVYAFTKAMISEPLVIGDVQFYNLADADARPLFTFSGDGFHPNTSAQARIAQIIVQTFNAKWPKAPIPALTDDEVVHGILGLP